jgi:hypothetical protein
MGKSLEELNVSDWATVWLRSTLGLVLAILVLSLIPAMVWVVVKIAASPH